jgi:hypothetical protein
VELLDERFGGARAPLQRTGKARVSCAAELPHWQDEIPLGLALITLTLIALCVINLFTKEVATVSGVAFTIIFFTVFEISEAVTRKRASAHSELDQFNIEPGDDLTPRALGIRSGNVLVMIRNYNTLYTLAATLDRVDPRKQDIGVPAREVQSLR